MTAPFDPAAWVAEYEALGGRVAVTRWAAQGDQPRLWLGVYYPSDDSARSRDLEAALNERRVSGSNRKAVIDYIAEIRGVLEAQS